MRGQKRKGPRRISGHLQYSQERPGGSPNPRSGQLDLLDVLQALRIFGTGHVGRDAREPSGSSKPAARSKPREAGSSPSWVRCRPSESPAPAARSKALGNPPNLRCQPHGRDARQISEAQEAAARRPWMRCRPTRIFDAGHVVRDAREPFGSSLPAARSESARQVSESREQVASRPWVNCNLPDLRRRQLD